jgi:hypothetical protein
LSKAAINRENAFGETRPPNRTARIEAARLVLLAPTPTITTLACRTALISAGRTADLLTLVGWKSEAFVASETGMNSTLTLTPGFAACL